MRKCKWLFAVEHLHFKKPPYCCRDDMDDRRWKKPHSMRVPPYCWCDKDALARYNMVSDSAV